jgi:uncharacterized protein YegP (UPF0339 family)
VWVFFRYNNRALEDPISLDAAPKIFPCSSKQNFRMRFEYWKSDDGYWRWELKTSIGDMLARGGSHPSREHCLTAMRLVKLAAGATSVEVAPRTAEPGELMGAESFRIEPA